MDNHPHLRVISAELDGASTIGRYQILRSIGRGAFGRVFACHDPLLDRQLAVKVVTPDVADDIREELFARFQSEAQVLGKLSHPNVVAVYDAGTEGRLPFLAMELCSGPSLDTVLRNGTRVPVGQSVWVILLAARALDYVHSMGIVHRDIKPANLLLHTNSLKVTDFGLALTESTSRLTHIGQVMGTPSFMSPEQVRGEHLSPCSDLYSLAAVLFTMLAGRPPFMGVPLVVMSQLATKDPPRLSSVVPGLPRALDEIMARALSLDPSNRYLTGKELCEALLQVVPARAIEPIAGAQPPPREPLEPSGGARVMKASTINHLGHVVEESGGPPQRKSVMQLRDALVGPGPAAASHREFSPVEGVLAPATPPLASPLATYGPPGYSPSMVAAPADRPSLLGQAPAYIDQFFLPGAPVAAEPDASGSARLWRKVRPTLLMFVPDPASLLGAGSVLILCAAVGYLRYQVLIDTQDAVSIDAPEDAASVPAEQATKVPQEKTRVGSAKGDGVKKSGTHRLENHGSPESEPREGNQQIDRPAKEQKRSAPAERNPPARAGSQTKPHKRSTSTAEGGTEPAGESDYPIINTSEDLIDDL